MDARAGSQLYQRDAPEAELASFQIGSLWIDLTNPVFNQTVGFGGSMSAGVPFDIHGDWLFVDPATVGAVECALNADSDDSRAITLIPGKAIQQKFDRIRIFTTPASSAFTFFANAGSIVEPGVKLFYGRGKCPFVPIHLPQGSPLPTANYINTFSVQTAANATFTPVAIPAGAYLDVSALDAQTTGAAETSLLRHVLVFTILGSPNPTIVVPDFESPVDIAVAGVGTSRGRARWRVRAPKGAYLAQVNVNNYGNAATNNIVGGSATMLLG